MRNLWAPWRHEYVSSLTEGPQGCIFCHAAEAADDGQVLVLRRDASAFALLNLYPYASGHVMIAPYTHAPRLSDLPGSERAALIELVARVEAALEAEYEPDGLNVGMNLGRGAGAGVPDHLHIHVVPRWEGDTNFMTTVAETRVIPEPIESVWRRLRDRLGGTDREGTR